MGRRDYCLLFLLALLPALLLWHTSPWGVAVSVDSIRYLQMSEVLLNDESLLNLGKHFPPGYPFFISMMTRLTGDAGLALRIGQVILTFVASLITLLLIYRFGGRQILICVFIALALVFRTETYLTLYYAWSEALALCFLLGMLWFLLRGIERNSMSHLCYAGLLGGCSVLVRYAGLPFLVTSAAILFFSRLQLPRRDRWKALAVYTIGGSTPLILWQSIVFLAGIEGVAREMSYHPSNTEQFVEGLTIVGRWFGQGYGIFTTGAGAVVFIWLTARAYVGASRKVRYRLTMIAVLALGYLVFLVLVLAFFDAYLELSERMFLPAFMLFTIAVGIVCSVVWACHSWLSKSICACFLVFFALGAADITGREAMDRRVNGEGLANRQYRTMEIWNHIDTFAGGDIVSNGSELLYLHAGLSSTLLPKKYNPVLSDKNLDFDQDMDRLREDVLSGRTTVVFFASMAWRDYLPDFEELVKLLNIRPIYLDKKTAVFKAG